jgi:beta-aspartyl-peptidase (threonine type)
MNWAKYGLKLAANRVSTIKRDCVIRVIIMMTASLLLSGCGTMKTSAHGNRSFCLAIHGGAGVISRAELTAEKEAECRAVLEQSLRAGFAILATNGTSLDAVTAAIRVMEDSPAFNAGKGAVLNEEGVAEMDAAIMEGTTLKAGAVAAERRIKTPIDAARAVMERPPHVVGAGADHFAEEIGLPTESPEYFITEPRRKQWREIMEKKRSRSELTDAMYNIGTVGAVALDQAGNLAAGTSTGGLAGKRVGRVGDTPIIGAGTFADNDTCAISGTGHGEFFIRYGVVRDISDLMRYRKIPLERAAETVVMKKLVKAGGEGGVIGMDRRGHIVMPFNSGGMYRGYIRQDAKAHVAIYRE